MTTYCAIVLTVNFLVLAVHTVRKERANNRILAHLNRAESREQQMWDVLTVIKSYQESGRVHHNEADIAKTEVTKTVETRADELTRKIDEVPAKVADALKSPDSGIINRAIK